MLAMTNWSGGVNTGCPRVKNLSKFSAPLPHCKKKREKKTEKNQQYIGSPSCLQIYQGERKAFPHFLQLVTENFLSRYFNKKKKYLRQTERI